MTMVNVADIKANLSMYLKRVEAGETVVVARHNRPIAELRPLRSRASGKLRPVGLARGEFCVPDDFNAALPEDVLRAFEGE